jgi:hypothetical protein
MVQGQESRKNQAGGETQSASGLLQSQERAILGKIAELDAPHSLRAQLLLALDSGASQTEASGRVGMSPRQARYWRDRFVQRGLDIFPQYLVAGVLIESLPDTLTLLPEGQEEKIMETAQEELEKMAEQPQELENQPEKLEAAVDSVEDQNQAGEDKKAGKAKSKKKKKSKKDKQAKQDKKKKSAKKAKGKQKSKKAKKKRGKK